MSDKTRLFVAARVPNEVLAQLSDAVDELRSQFPKARWVPVANQHVTLKFVGWLPSDSLSEAERAVAGAVEGTSAADISVTGIGAFPSPRRIRVLWAGLEDPAGTMACLAGALNRAFEPLGIEPETRPFSPHLTLARFPAPMARHDPLPQIALAQPDFRLTSVELLSSHLSPRGARYESLRSFPLDVDD